MVLIALLLFDVLDEFEHALAHFGLKLISIKFFGADAAQVEKLPDTQLRSLPTLQVLNTGFYTLHLIVVSFYTGQRFIENLLPLKILPGRRKITR